LAARIHVTFEGTRHELMAGSEISDMIQLQSPAIQAALLTGGAIIVDSHGNEVGSGGGLWEGQDLHLVWPP
jgi:hypothetical protein